MRSGRPAFQGDALRSMKAPGTAYDDPLVGKDPQPAHMNKYVETQQDNGGVHINSGIPNHAFYTVATTLGGRSWEAADRSGTRRFATRRSGQGRASSASPRSRFASPTAPRLGERRGQGRLRGLGEGWRCPPRSPRRRCVSRRSGSGGIGGLSVTRLIDTSALEAPMAAEVEHSRFEAPTWPVSPGVHLCAAAAPIDSSTTSASRREGRRYQVTAAEDAVPPELKELVAWMLQNGDTG